MPHLLVLTAMCCGLCGNVTMAQTVQNARDVYNRLHSGHVSDATANAVRNFLETRYEKQDLSKGTHKHLGQTLENGGGYAVWVLKAPENAHPVVVAEKDRRWPMTRLGNSDLWVAAEKFPNFSSAHYRYEVNGERLGGNDRVGFESYEVLPESQEQPGVPKGELIEMERHVSKKFFPGAERQWWVYVPAQYKADGPEAKLIVFNDGAGFCKGEGNACIVMDNLIHQGKIPVMIAIFINPGSFPAAKPGAEPRSNRSNEYDTCTPRYATFLDEEILPIVREKYRISADPWDHAILGSSSGASCAFTAAWHRNDLFRRVISFVGSYCDFRSVQDYPVYGESYSLKQENFGQWKTAHDYPGLIRKTNPRKEIKVFLQDGENDLDNTLGNWFLNNQRMAAALAYSAYDFKFVAGKGIHSSRHGKAILPEILVWMWAK
jgi:enterochelin esterase family protein